MKVLLSVVIHNTELNKNHQVVIETISFFTKKPNFKNIEMRK